MSILYCNAEGQAVLFKNGKGLWGFKDKAGKVLVEPKYYYKPDEFSEGRAVFSKSFVLKGVLDEQGQEIVPPTYYTITAYKNGFAVVTQEVQARINDKLTKTYQRGLIDRTGKVIVPIIYKNIDGDFSNGWFVVAYNDSKERIYYDKSGNKINVPADLYLFSEKVDGKKIIAMKGGKQGLIDDQFKEILPFEYSGLRGGENGTVIAGQNGLFGLMDNKLKWILKPQFKFFGPYKAGYAMVTDTANLVGAINQKGVVTTKPQFGTVYRLDKTSSAIAAFKNTGSDRLGLVNLANGKILLSPSYNLNFNSFDYDYGLVVFKRDGKKGMMDSTGKELFYAAYDDFSSGFLDGRAWVSKGGKYGFIDKTGKLVIPAQYEVVNGFSEGLAKVRSEGKCGFIGLNGEVVIPLIYTDAQSFESGIAWVKDENNQTFYIDKKGKKVE